MEIDVSYKGPDLFVLTTKKQGSGFKTIIRGYSIKEGKDKKLKLVDIANSHYDIFDANTTHQQEPFIFQIFDDNLTKNYWLFTIDGKRKLIRWET